MGVRVDEETGLHFYYYGDEGAPAGAGKECQEFPRILKEARDSIEPFNDPNFPPTAASIGELKSDGSPPLLIQWKRCADIAQAMFGATPPGSSGSSSGSDSDSGTPTPKPPPIPTVVPVFEGVVNQFDVQQGQLGDCWFLSTLSDVATKPKLIKILVPEDNKTVGFETGVFHFQFWCRGKWLDVVVDDQLPCIMNGDQIESTAFSTPTKNGGFWAPLLEKAYAKIYGNYADIQGGLTTDAMEDFTGGIVHYYYGTDMDAESFKKNIQGAVKKDCLIGFGTVENLPADLQRPKDPNNPGPEDVSIEGIVEGHAYTILNIQDVTGNDGTVYTLVNCRNPWGDTTEWTGDFGNADKNGLWKTVDRDLRPGSGDTINNGQFWIPVENLREYVDSLSTCDWGKTYLRDTSSKTSRGEILIDFGNFPEECSGDLEYTSNLQGKPGYYVYLRSSDPDTGEVKDGVNYNCELSVTLMYTDYTKSGNDPDIPNYGFYAFWSNGENKPVGEQFFDTQAQVLNTDVFEDKVREINWLKDLPAGTVLIVPWIKHWDGKGSPYYFRIVADGEIHKVRDSDSDNS